MSKIQLAQSVPKPIPEFPTSEKLPDDQAKSHQIDVFPFTTQNDLLEEGDEPMETGRHKAQMELLINPLRLWLDKQNGGYVNGNIPIYFSERQLKTEDVKCPDVFVVLGASYRERRTWVVWEEQKTPDVIIELLSESTKNVDKNGKKLIYQNRLKAPEYFWFDPFNPEDWAGFTLQDGIYQPIAPDTQNRLLSQRLGLALVRWHGINEHIKTVWLRWATLEGELLPTPQEDAIAANQRALEAEQRANAAEAEIARLKALLKEQ
jgi:Uma2 family endonuclease